MNTECNCATCRRKQSESQLAQAQARIAELELENSWLQGEIENAADSGAEAQARITELEAALKVIEGVALDEHGKVRDMAWPDDHVRCAEIARKAREKKP